MCNECDSNQVQESVSVLNTWYSFSVLQDLVVRLVYFNHSRIYQQDGRAYVSIFSFFFNGSKFNHQRFSLLKNIYTKPKLNRYLIYLGKSSRFVKRHFWAKTP